MRLRMAAVNALVSRVMSARGLLGAGRAQVLRASRAGAQRLVVRVAHLLPFVQQARVHLADHRAQVELHLPHRVGLGAVGHGLAEHLVDAVQVPQQHALGALQFVVADVIGERAELLEHLAGDGLGPDVLLAHPRVLVGEGVEGRSRRTRGCGFGIFELLQLLHPLVVFHARRPSSRAIGSVLDACPAACAG